MWNNYDIDHHNTRDAKANKNTDETFMVVDQYTLEGVMNWCEENDYIIGKKIQTYKYRAVFCPGYAHAGKPGYEDFKKSDDVISEAFGETEMDAIRNLMYQSGTKVWYWKWFAFYTKRKEIFSDNEWWYYVDREFKHCVNDLDSFNNMLGVAFDDYDILDRYAKVFKL